MSRERVKIANRWLAGGLAWASETLQGEGAEALVLRGIFSLLYFDQALSQWLEVHLIETKLRELRSVQMSLPVQLERD